MVNVRCLRNERATKCGRYFNFSAAANTLSFVDCGIAAEPRAPFKTTETVAVDRSKCRAKVFRLTAARSVVLAGRSNFFRGMRECATASAGVATRSYSYCAHVLFTIFLQFLLTRPNRGATKSPSRPR